MDLDDTNCRIDWLLSFLSALLRCFAVAMCCVMSYLPLAAMLKSAEHNVHLAWFSPFPWRLYEVPAARILLLESLFSFIFGRHHTYKLYKIFLVKSASKLPERTTSVKFRSHAITTGTPNAFRRRVLIGCYRLLNAETTNHTQPLIERVPKSHGGLVLTASRSDFVISLFRSRFDFIIFFLPGVAQIRIFMEKICTPVFYINSRTKYGKNVLVWHVCWPNNLHWPQNYADWRIRAAVLAVSVQPFYVSCGTNKHFAWWKSWMVMRRNLKEFGKTKILCSLPWCFWRYEAFHNNTVEHIP